MTKSKKIAVFSPFPPIKSGISTSMMKILPFINECYDCDVFIDDGYQPEINVDGVNIFNHRFFEEKIDEYAACLFQMANSIFHSYMIPYIVKYGGIIILHDLNLHQFTLLTTIYNRNFANYLGDYQKYLSILQEDFGHEAYRIMQSLASHPNLPMEKVVIRHYVKNAKGILVHNEFTKTSLQERHIHNVRIAGLPIELPPEPLVQINKDYFMFACFGIGHGNKHIDLAIRCIRRLLHSGCHDVRLFLVGEYDPDYLSYLHNIIQNSHLSAHVYYLNHVDEQKYRELMQQTDVSINLRYPTVGETSAALIDAMSYGKATIVSNVDGFIEIPENVALKINHNQQNEEDQLYLAMLNLYRNRNLRSYLGKQARLYVAQRHSITQYVNVIKILIKNSL